MTSANQQKIRQRLFEADPHCHWCGRETFNRDGPRVHQRKNDATLDHLYSKLDDRRVAHSDRPHKYVLACHECNGKRATEEHKRLSPEENRLRSWGGVELYRNVT